MRVALLADVQGNALALEAAFSDMRRYEPDQIICLGDVATGPNPNAVIHLLRQNDCAVVMGNMDAAILDMQPYTGQDTEARNYAEIDNWCAAQLNADDRDYIHAFHSTIRISLVEMTTLLCCHGSPQSFDDVIDSITPAHELDVMLADRDTTIVAVGHMHNPMLRRHRNQWIVNPGSVGLPGGAKHLPMSLFSEYAVVERVNGTTRFHFERIRYDAQQFRERVLHSGMPHANWYLAKRQADSRK